MRSRAHLLPALAALTTLLTSLPAPARADPMGVGLYADMAGTRTELSVPAFTPFWLYLVVDRPYAQFRQDVCPDKTDPILADFVLRLRCRFEIPGNIWIINFDESLGDACGAFDLSTDPEIDATWMQAPCRGTEFCRIWPCLLRVGLMTLDDRPAPIRLRPGADGGAEDGNPTFRYGFHDCWTGETCSGTQGLRPLPDGPDHPVFVVNRGAVAVEGQTWGTLKALYR